MSWEAIQAAAQVQPAGAGMLPDPLAALQLDTQAAGPGANAAALSVSSQFGRMVSEGIEGVNGQLLASQTGLQQLAMGTAPNLHQVMIGLEESRLSFQLLMQVRNRLLDAYQEVMKMQV